MPRPAGKKYINLTYEECDPTYQRIVSYAREHHLTPRRSARDMLAQAGSNAEMVARLDRIEQILERIQAQGFSVVPVAQPAERETSIEFDEENATSNALDALNW